MRHILRNFQNVPPSSERSLYTHLYLVQNISTHSSLFCLTPKVVEIRVKFSDFGQIELLHKLTYRSFQPSNPG